MSCTLSGSVFSFNADPRYIGSLISTIRPTLKDLLDFVAAVWYNVGLQLDLEPHVLDEIETEKSD